jgi:hypothetical protein
MCIWAVIFSIWIIKLVFFTVVCTFHLFGQVYFVVSEMERSKDVKEYLIISFMSYSLHVCFVSMSKQQNVKLNSVWMTVWLNVLQCQPYFIAVREQTYNLKLWYRKGPCGSAFGWGTALQVGRSRVWFPMVSLVFFIDVILQAALWPWGRLSL